MDNRDQHQSFGFYETPLASSTFVKNVRTFRTVRNSFGDSTEENDNMEYHALRKGMVKKRIHFWDEHFRKLAEKQGVVEIPQKTKIVKKTVKLVKSGVYSCSGPCPGYHFISNKTLTTTVSSDCRVTNSSGIASMTSSDPKIEYGKDSDETVYEEGRKIDEVTMPVTDKVRDEGSDPPEEDGFKNRDTDQTSEPTPNTISKCYDLMDLDDEIFKKKDYLTETLSHEVRTEIQPAQDLWSNIRRTATMYTGETIVAFLIFRAATSFLSYLL